MNLLAANANLLDRAVFGSGIYAGRRASSNAFIATEPITKVLIADVPIDPTPIDQITENSSDEPSSTFSEYNVLSEDLSGYTIKFLNTSGMQSGEVQSNGMRCKYEVSITDLGERKNEV